MVPEGFEMSDSSSFADKSVEHRRSIEVEDDERKIAPSASNVTINIESLDQVLLKQESNESFISEKHDENQQQLDKIKLANNVELLQPFSPDQQDADEEARA